MMEPREEYQIREIIAVELQCAPGDVCRGVSLRKDLGMDSVAAINIVFAIEENFGIRFPEAELEKIDNMEQVLRLVSVYGSKI